MNANFNMPPTSEDLERAFDILNKTENAEADWEFAARILAQEVFYLQGELEFL